MSATFRLSKKKVSQNDLRRLMTDHKEKLQSQKVKKIDSPLAKYNETGQLMCILCKSVVRSENVWNVHINTKQHKENIEYAKKLKVQTQNFTTTPKVTANAFKRPAPASPHSGQPKRIKGILKNSQSSANVPADFFDLGGSSSASLNKDVESSQYGAVTQTEKTEHNSKEDVPDEPATEVEDPAEVEEVLPEGFFDDPKMDAKARHVQYKDPIEEEWEKFQKEMKEETSVSAAIIAGEHEEATAERQIDEIDEQIRNWSRVLDLDRKKEEAKTQKDLENTAAMDCDRSSSDDEDDFDEYLDWRAKKSYT